jgi:phosphomannomutase
VPRPRAYVFDVDGTLTVSRTLMDPEFKKFFTKFTEYNKVYIVTGSDYSKTLEQLGEDTMHAVERSYNCSGNSIWENGTNVHNNEWKLDETPWKYLEARLNHSHFEPKTGWHFDERPGLLNFSILGRNAKPHQRAMYEEFDRKHNEREYIASEFNFHFQTEYKIVAQVAGATGLDIMPIGKDKRQILKDFDDMHVTFFGDMMQPGGNDAPLKNAIIHRNNTADKVIQVTDWQHTYNELKEITNGN